MTVKARIQASIHKARQGWFALPKIDATSSDWQELALLRGIDLARPIAQKFAIRGEIPLRAMGMYIAGLSEHPLQWIALIASDFVE